jgi:lysophospholipase L1-like esterase
MAAIVASGTIKVTASDPGTTPAGDSMCVADSSFTLPGAHCLALIGRIGNAPAFEVGSRDSLFAATAGTLFLGVNDQPSHLADNSDAWSADVIVAPPPPNTQGPNTNLMYAALGDSIASGHGLGTTTTPATPGRNKNCQRSAGDSSSHDAYPDDVRDFAHDAFGLALDGQHYFKLACSGDIVSQMLRLQVPAAEQALANNPAIITITIGVDNFRFADPNTYIEAFSPLTYGDFQLKRVTKLAVIEHQLSRALSDLGSGRPQRLVVVTTYYNPFNPQSVIFAAADAKGAACEQTVGDRPPCAQIVQDTLDMLNTAIGNAVVDYSATLSPLNAQVRIVGGVDQAFNPDGEPHHSSPMPFCGSGPPGFADTYIQAQPTGQLNINRPPKNGNDCFHPNPQGHAVIAGLVEAQLPGS